MTLVEVMVSMVVFAIAILGTMSVLIFSLRTVDDSRAFTQATQILNHEMESMRMRAWSDRQLVVDTAGHSRVLHGLSTLGDKGLAKGATFPGGVVTAALSGDTALPGAVSESYTTFAPFAVYGKQVVADNDPTSPPYSPLVAVISGPNAYDVAFTKQPTPLRAQYRNASGTAAGFTCTRRVTLFNNGAPGVMNYAIVTLTVEWDDLRKRHHSRSMTSTMSQSGLNAVIYDLSQVQ